MTVLRGDWRVALAEAYLRDGDGFAGRTLRRMDCRREFALFGRGCESGRNLVRPEPAPEKSKEGDSEGKNGLFVDVLGENCFRHKWKSSWMDGWWCWLRFAELRAGYESALETSFEDGSG